MKHIAVLGAGITGVTTAHALMDKGFEVTVYDRNRYAAMETSFANGGQLSASNAEVWNSWATVMKGLKWMLRSDAPLLVNPKPSWHKYSWMLEFLGHIPHYRRNTIETVRLALQAREALFDMAAREGVDFDHETRGILHVYKSTKSLAAADRVSELYAEGGLSRRRVTPAEMREIDPALTADYIGGWFTESDSTGDIHKLTVGLAKAIERRGATLRYGSTVTRVATEGGGVRVFVNGESAGLHDGIVVCAGVHSRAFAAQLGDRVNIYPVKGYSITVELDEESQAAAPWVSLLDDDAKIVTSRLGADRFRVAGTAEYNGFNRDIRADRIRPLVDWVATNFPGMATERCIPWAGLRPMMPNMLPRMGRGRAPGVFYNTGHGHLGWTLSGATARIVADVVAGAEASAPRPVSLGGAQPA
ncbi:D-amino acid dehydrogenase [Paroceanicella profunda]|uniref:D-amino acid dehydrogenase n=1 Tax=Paroceanicella profunda TaxID=2579971 RepID=A0A5B8FH76_9RHOB|nr:D-amino acid dehydrogenase [Paroceanicella profunda]QDL92101.1 D-amino acid dehydrogenase [Paroceanicella profunda]